jgi:transposase-like protein
MSKHDKPEIMSAWDFIARFQTDKDARKHIERMRWGDEPICAHCGSLRISRIANEKPQPYRCKDCRKHFSVTTGTVFHSANLSPRKCLYAMFLMIIEKKSISSCQMARELGCTQKTAWYLARRIRETWLNKSGVGDPKAAEGNETDIGGRERNKYASEKLRAGCGLVGKQPVVGMRELNSGRVKARPVPGTDATHLKSAIRSEVKSGSTPHTDGHRAYRGMCEYRHEAVEHSVGEFVRDMARKDGTESFWALLKRGYFGTSHRFSEKHLARYVDEFATRYNLHGWDMMAHIDRILRNARGVLGYKALTAN